MKLQGLSWVVLTAAVSTSAYLLLSRPTFPADGATLSLQRATPQEIFAALSEQTGQRIEPPPCLEDLKIDLDVQNAPLSIVVELVAEKLDLVVKSRGTKIVLDCKTEGHRQLADLSNVRISLNFEDAPIETVLQEVNMQLGLEGVDYHGPKVQVSIRLTEVRFKLVQQVLLDMGKLNDIQLQNGRLLVQGGKRTKTASRAPEATEHPSAKPSPPEPSSATAGSPSSVAPQTTFTAIPLGTLPFTGHVRYLGDVPDPRPIKNINDPKCKLLMSAEDRMIQPLVVNEGRLSGALVYVENPPNKGAYSPRHHEVIYPIEQCRVPQTLAMMVGDTLVPTNHDPLLHMVNAMGRRFKFHVALPKKGMKRQKRVKKAKDAIRRNYRFDGQSSSFGKWVNIKCDVHSWEHSHLAIFDHPYFAITDENGGFQLPDLPPGEYAVVVQHPELDPVRTFIDHRPGQDTVELEIEARD